MANLSVPSPGKWISDMFGNICLRLFFWIWEFGIRYFSIFFWFFTKNWENAEKSFWSFLVFFRQYLIFLTSAHQSSYSKDPFCFNEKFWNPVFAPQTQIFIPNFRPEFRTFDQQFERSTGNSNVRPELPTTTEFSRCPVLLNFDVFPDFECSTGNSNVRPGKFRLPPNFSLKQNGSFEYEL